MRVASILVTAVFGPLLVAGLPAPLATVTLFGPLNEGNATEVGPVFSETLSLSGFDSAQSVATYVEVDFYPSQSEFGLAATTQTETVIDGPSAFVYVGSDAYEGGYTESCAVSGSVASCVAIGHLGSPGPTGVFGESSLPVSTVDFGEIPFGPFLTAEVSDGLVVFPTAAPADSGSAAMSGSAPDSLMTAVPTSA